LKPRIRKVLLKNNDCFEKGNIAKNIFGYDIKTNKFNENYNHYFINFSINNPNISLYYQLTHGKYKLFPDFYKLTDLDIFGRSKPQKMSNYFYYIGNELTFKFFNDYKKTKLK
jgi:hypothetical protein